jgi:FkbM family methyltransferase
VTKPSDRGKRSKAAARVRGPSPVTNAKTPLRADPQMQILRESEALALESDADIQLGRLRTAWCMGDWETLANLSIRGLTHHPERHRIALLVASAQQQLGQHEQARHNVRLALSWGCAPRLVAQILIAGVHNTLGRAAALTRDTERSQQHFNAAVLPSANESDMPLLSQVRSLREMSRLELLPEAANLLGTAIATTRSATDRPEQTNARIKVLESELDLLNHELSIAQQRQMMLRPLRESEVTRSEVGSAQWLQELRRRSMSQLGQDLWVLEKSAYKRGGFFVEFGATDGVLLSNTYLLEKEFAWTGLCAEPNPKMFEQLRRNRKCVVSDACIAAASGKEVDFVFAGAFGGMAEHCSADLHRERRAAYAAAGHVGRLSTVSLDDFLRGHRAPYDIDYLSIDTEGSELEILAAFPFDRWNIRLITIEHNNTPQKQSIFDLLHSHGYQRIEREWEDWYSRTDNGA